MRPSELPTISVIPSRSPVINEVTGIGGFPRGNITEIFGPESSGKSTIALESIAECQRRFSDSVCAYLDFDHTFDLTYAARLGVKVDNRDKFIVVQPAYLEQGQQVLYALLDQGAIDLAVIDSAPAMIPKVEIEGSLYQPKQTRIGLQYRLMRRFIYRLPRKLKRGRGCALIILNQTRMKGDFPSKDGALHEDAAGGNPLRDCSSLRPRLEMIGFDPSQITASQGAPGITQIYNRTNVKITAVKNDLSSPLQSGTFTIIFGAGNATV